MGMYQLIKSNHRMVAVHWTLRMVRSRVISTAESWDFKKK